jgi:hypothetical protein
MRSRTKLTRCDGGAASTHSRLLLPDHAGHGVMRADWETIVRAILDHTAADAPPR